MNLGDYYLMVNGTLAAAGTSNSLIQFSRGSIIFTQYSIGWNHQTSIGSVIDHANLTSTPITIDATTPRISNSYTEGITVNGGSPTISNNNINDEINITAGSPTISDNQIKTIATIVNPVFSQLTIYQPVNSININGSPIISNNIITVGGQIYDNYGRDQGTASTIQVNGGSPTISGNIINGVAGGSLEVYSSCTISNNIFHGWVEIVGGSGSSIVSNNIFYDGGLRFGSASNGYINGGNPIVNENISGNVFSSCYAYAAAISVETLDSVTIAGNLVTASIAGINIQQSSNLDIQNNTIVNNNGNGIKIANSPLATISYNNIQNNTQYNVALVQGQSINIDATNNWWGTADASVISKTIYDYYKDFNLGKVNFTPFLNSASATAPTLNYTPQAGSTLTPLPTATSSPTASPYPSTTAPSPTASPYPSTTAPSPTATPNPSTTTSANPTPITPEYPSLVIAIIMLTIVTIAIVFRKKSIKYLGGNFWKAKHF